MKKELNGIYSFDMLLKLTKDVVDELKDYSDDKRSYDELNDNEKKDMIVFVYHVYKSRYIQKKNINQVTEYVLQYSNHSVFILKKYSMLNVLIAMDKVKEFSQKNTNHKIGLESIMFNLSIDDSMPNIPKKIVVWLLKVSCTILSLVK